MKNRKFYAFLVVIMLFACGSAKAQTQVYLNLGASFPTGDFAEGDDEYLILTDENSDGGGAGFGANLGFKFLFPTKANGLSVLLSIDGVYNGLNSDVKDAIDKMEDEYSRMLEQQLGDDFNFHAYTDIHKPSYFNIPLMAGLNYCYDFNDNFGIYGEAGIGADLRIISKLKLDAEGSGTDVYYHEKVTASLKVTQKYDPTVSFAFQVGAGVKISNRFTIGFNFYNLGSAKVKGELSSKVKVTYAGQSDSSTDKEKYNASSLSNTMVLLRFGIRL